MMAWVADAKSSVANLEVVWSGAGQEIYAQKCQMVTIPTKLKSLQNPWRCQIRMFWHIPSPLTKFPVACAEKFL